MAQGFDVSGLSAYVEQNRLPLITKTILGGKTINLLSKQLGVKGTANLNILSLDPTIASGASCGFSAGNAPVLTERAIATGQMKVNIEICPRTLLGKWAEYQVRLGAGQDVLPFEQEIMDELSKQIQNKMEKLVWQAKTSAHSGTDQFDGFLYIAGNDSNTIKESISSGASAWDAVSQVYNAIPEEIRDKAVIFVDPAIYRAFLADMVSQNFYHYNPQDGADGEVMYPASKVRVINCAGLAGTKKLFACALDNVYFGTDMLEDAEKFDIWFSKDDDVFKIAVKWNAGVQYAFSDQIVLGTMAGSPVLLGSMAGNIAGIAGATAEIADDDHVFKTQTAQ